MRRQARRIAQFVSILAVLAVADGIGIVTEYCGCNSVHAEPRSAVNTTASNPSVGPTNS
jgi:hypothetical protein